MQVGSEFLIVFKSILMQAHSLASQSRGIVNNVVVLACMLFTPGAQHRRYIWVLYVIGNCGFGVQTCRFRPECGLHSCWSRCEPSCVRSSWSIICGRDIYDLTGAR
jgi:hypothetical protein